MSQEETADGLVCRPVSVTKTKPLSSHSSPANSFTLLFEFDGNVNAIRHVLYKCSAARPSIESETKEDTIEPGTEKLTITADPRSDGLVKARTGDTTSQATYDGGYSAVYVPDTSETEEEQTND